MTIEFKRDGIEVKYIKHQAIKSCYQCEAHNTNDCEVLFKFCAGHGWQKIPNSEEVKVETF